MTLPDLRPRIGDNPTCSEATLRQTCEVLQEQIDTMNNGASTYANRSGLWGKATHNWSTDRYVTVNPCERDGSNTDTGTTHTVYFPDDPFHDPNVIVDQVIPYTAMNDETYATTASMDDKVGTAKQWVLDAQNIPQGWSIMSNLGGENSTADGGSGITTIDRFVRGNRTPGTLAGQVTIPPLAFTTDPNGGFSKNVSTEIIGFAITNTALTGITIDDHTSTEVTDCIQDHTKQEVVDCIKDHDASDIAAAINIDDHSDQDIIAVLNNHDDHAHTLNGSAAVAAGTDFTVVADGECSSAWEDPTCGTSNGDVVNHTGTGQVVSHNISASTTTTSLPHDPHDTNDPLEHNPVAMQVLNHTVNDSGHTHNLTDPGHNHSLTVADHTHTGETDSIPWAPSYVTLTWIERIDNSTEFTGL